MKRLVILFLCNVLAGCSTHKAKEQKKPSLASQKLPEVVRLDSSFHTDFALTPEHRLTAGKNWIYAPTMIYAWRELEKALTSIHIDDNAENTELHQLQQTEGDKGAMDENEYAASARLSGKEVQANASFTVVAGFKPALEKLPFPIRYKGVEVAGFGMLQWDDQIANQLSILYYKNDSNFIFKLKTDQENTEIIFMEGLATNAENTFGGLTRQLNQYIEKGNSERKDSAKAWKYALTAGETFAIPELAFNLEKGFTSMVGRQFTSEHQPYIITVATQRNALILNNYGAKVTSKAEMAVAPAPVEIVEQSPRQLFLDRAFVVVMKHTDRQQPFFAMKVVNPELMVKAGKP